MFAYTLNIFFRKTLYLSDNTLESIRKGCIIHQIVRKKIQPLLRPGQKMSTLANVIESTTRSFKKR